MNNRVLLLSQGKTKETPPMSHLRGIPLFSMQGKSLSSTITYVDTICTYYVQAMGNVEVIA
jgi:hypothetical protein